MKVVIVFESMFGNTEQLAGAVAAGLAGESPGCDVAVVAVGDATAEDFLGAGLVVVAAPTHALSLSRPRSRAEAVAQGAPAARASIGLREWLPLIGALEPRPDVAVFDTRATVTRHWPGSAGRQAARSLRRAGLTVVARTSFYVEGVKGPLVPGELLRARAWGVDLAARTAVDAG